MNILIMTNTYKPLVGGLERSIESFANEYRKQDHRVVIVVPEYPDMKPEEDVVRIPAVANFSGTNFSLQLPIPGALSETLGKFRPDIVHSQHPFLIGDTALRVACEYNVPLVFTHHTLYEENVHYLPGNEEALKRFVIELSTGYANLADCVFAPSESVMDLMKERGVQAPIHVVPTGIYVNDFSRGSGRASRKKSGIPPDAFVVGYAGRLAPEKNLEFLARAVVRFMKTNLHAYFFVVGHGPSEDVIKEIFSQGGMADRLVLGGLFKDKALANAYHAMDVFVFASQSETQGLVLGEAMACSVPVVAVDAPGVREVVKDRVNGYLLSRENIDDFVIGLEWVQNLTLAKLKTVKKACRQTASRFSMKISVEKALAIYKSLCIQGFFRKAPDQSYWESKLRLAQGQWKLMKNLTKATGAMIGLSEDKEDMQDAELKVHS